MKKEFLVFLLVLMLGVGVLLAYQEAHAYPYACLFVQDYCYINCNGLFSLDDCWVYQGETYCWFTCRRILLPDNCYWDDPTYGQCQGAL